MKKIINITSLAVLSLIPGFALALKPLQPYVAPPVTIKDPSENGTTAANVLGVAITWVLLLVGGLAVLFLLWGGLQYVTSSGNKDKAEQAKQTITYAVIGLIVIVLARVIVTLVTGLPFSLGITTS